MPRGSIHIGFYHPFCNSGGGGERVLWKLVESLGIEASRLLPPRVASDASDLSSGSGDYGQFDHGTEADDEVKNSRRSPSIPKYDIAIYTCETASHSEIIASVEEKFQIKIPPLDILPLRFVYFENGKSLLDPSNYKSFTLLGQSIGTMRFTWSILKVDNASDPKPLDLFFDTTGCAFTYPIAKLFTYLKHGKCCKVLSYTHYPTISTDMLAMVYSRRPSYNNSAMTATSNVSSYMKLLYYVIFAFVYGVFGSLVDVSIVNSTWTCNHIKKLWFFAPDPIVVFPPCDVVGFSELEIVSDDNKNEVGREKVVLSIGQFRPEKDHALQIRSFALFLDSIHDAEMRLQWKLVLLGSCRDDQDLARVDELRLLASDHNITSQVSFTINQPYTILKAHLSTASVGIHTMWNEHFGIGVVEMMASGLIVVAHDSGGPKADIVKEAWTISGMKMDGISSKVTGYLASTAEEYSECLKHIAQLSNEEQTGIRERARESVQRFSDQEFDRVLGGLVESVGEKQEEENQEKQEEDSDSE